MPSQRSRATSLPGQLGDDPERLEPLAAIVGFGDEDELVGLGRVENLRETLGNALRSADDEDRHPLRKRHALGVTHLDALDRRKERAALAAKDAERALDHGGRKV